MSSRLSTIPDSSVPKPERPASDFGRVPTPVVVLNWNGLADTRACIDALLQSRGVEFRVIVIDNGSDGDDYGQLCVRFGGHDRVELRRNADNLGFAGGVNAVLAELLALPTDARPSYVALLNNDALPEPDWLRTLLDRAERTGAAAVASRMLRLDDPETLDNAGHVFLNTGEVLPRGAGQPARYFDQVVDVEGACGGACLYRTAALTDIGVFDEFFDTGYEDAEWGLRAMLAGYRQVYEPAAVVRHRIGASIDRIRNLDYAVRLQVNIHYTYLKTMPAAVVLWNSPWLVLKSVALLTVPILFGRWRLLRVQWLALIRTVGLAPTILSARRQAGPRRISSAAVISRQEWFFRRYVGYLRRIAQRGEKTIFER